MLQHAVALLVAALVVMVLAVDHIVQPVALQVARQAALGPGAQAAGMVVRRTGLDGIRDALLESLGEALAQGQEDVGLGLEVVIEGTLGDPRGSDDVADGGGVHTLV